MLELAVMFGVGLWLLERLAFAILLLWAWGATVSLADQMTAELTILWGDRPDWVRVIV
jgi:hypothetical protein